MARSRVFPAKPLSKADLPYVLSRGFWDRVSIGRDSECWPWLMSVDRGGYGQIVVSENGKSRRLTATRVAFVLGHRDLRHGEGVLHHCDNPRCCNPGHLYAGLPAENTRDAVVRRRMKAAPPSAGEMNPRAKLSDERAREIYSRLKDGGSVREVAREYSISEPTVSAIGKGRKWAHLGLDPLPSRRGAHLTRAARQAHLAGYAVCGAGIIGVEADA